MTQWRIEGGGVTGVIPPPPIFHKKFLENRRVSSCQIVMAVGTLFICQTWFYFCPHSSFNEDYSVFSNMTNTNIKKFQNYIFWVEFYWVNVKNSRLCHAVADPEGGFRGFKPLLQSFFFFLLVSI